jgi:hypothetical protein
MGGGVGKRRRHLQLVRRLPRARPSWRRSWVPFRLTHFSDVAPGLRALLARNETGVGAEILCNLATSDII